MAKLLVQIERERVVSLFCKNLQISVISLLAKALRSTIKKLGLYCYMTRSEIWVESYRLLTKMGVWTICMLTF